MKRRVAVGILSLTFGFDLREHVGDPTTNRGSLFGGTVPPCCCSTRHRRCGRRVPFVRLA